MSLFSDMKTSKIFLKKVHLLLVLEKYTLLESSNRGNLARMSNFSLKNVVHVTVIVML